MVDTVIENDRTATPFAPQPAATKARLNPHTSILHVDVWYDGKQGEMNLIGPNLGWGEFIELQYIYLRQYFRKVGEMMKLEAYQASICSPREDGTFKIVATYEKVIFLPEDAFVPGQYWNCQKGGPKA